MMETVLNLGLNDQSVEALAQRSGNRRFALDAYRRLFMMYGSTARGINREYFEEAFDTIKEQRTRQRLDLPMGSIPQDTDVNEGELEELIGRYKAIYSEHTDEEFPQDPYEQLFGSINAVFDSWMADKAVTYRRVEKISGLAGTAVNICQMVFGNMGDDCGTGVCFTRDPNTGENVYYGDLLMNAQGEDVVAGVRTPVRLIELNQIMPEAYEQLEAVRAILEVHYRDMQDLEFTIERGKLYMLQCRNGKRSPAAAFKIAVDQASQPVIPPDTARTLVKKKYLPARYAQAAAKPVITQAEAIERIAPADIERLFYPVIDSQIDAEERERRHLGEGISAVPGAATGRVVFSSERAEQQATAGERVILICRETSPEDVARDARRPWAFSPPPAERRRTPLWWRRGWGKCCIVGCSAMRVDAAAASMTINGRTFSEGDYITLDGTTGSIFDGQLPLVRPEAPPEYETLMSWCDAKRRLGVRTNADRPQDAARAVELGAEGIGLCRTEHMFFDPSEPQRIRAVREMILARDEAGRKRALDKLLPFQRRDFEGLFEAMDGKPVTIRLLDPPLHEFLPSVDHPEAQQEAADDLNAHYREELDRLEEWDYQKRRELEAALVTVDDIRQRIVELREVNPMLGHRGCRLSVTYPEILEMQVRAIMAAAVACAQRNVRVLPEIMIPLTIDGREMALLAERVRDVARAELTLGLGTAEEIEQLHKFNDQIRELRREVADLSLSTRGRGIATLTRCEEELSQVIAQRKKMLASSSAIQRLPYLTGTMIETPRAALVADRMAESATFFSFGTNDLTQTTMALSRDDAGRFLPEYVDPNRAGIFDSHPFETLDIEGVGQLVFIGIEKGRSVRPDLKIGICGEHGGEANTIRFCHAVGMDYVSCSPLRVPIARLAAAQAAIEQDAVKKTAAAKRPPAKRKPAPRTAAKAKAKKATKKKAAKRPVKKSKKKVKKTTKKAKAAKKPGKAKKTKAAKKTKKTKKTKKAEATSKSKKAKKKAKRRARR